MEGLARVECASAAGEAALEDSIRRHVEASHRLGFLAYRQDSIAHIGDTTLVYFTQGRMYLAFESDDLRRRRAQTSYYPMSSSRIRAAALNALQPYEDNGYPFAQVILTAEALSDSSFSFSQSVDPGRLISYDSLVIRSDRPFREAYFRQYLSVRRGRPYSEAKLRDLPRLIDELNYVRSERSPEVVFQEDRADLYLYLSDVRANRFDGIIGLQPDAATGRPVVTGDLTLDLENAFRQGEEVSFRWRRIKEQTQDLRIHTALPYLLQTRIGIWAGAELYRRDTSFTSNELSLALGYLLGANTYVRTFVQSWRSNPLREGLADVDDIRVQRYGIAYRNQRLDAVRNPMRGYLIELETSAGVKDLFDIEGAESAVRVSQFAGSGRFSKWFQLSQRFALIVHGSGGFKLDSTLRLNEYHRIGGLNSLRGFDEEAFFARNYGVLSTELKFKLDQSSAFFLFADQGWYDRVDDGYFSDRPLGFGAGALIGTENSTFRIYYALGREQDNPVLVRNGKVHFGFINRF